MSRSLRPETFPFLDLTRGTMASLVFLSHCALFTGSAGPLRHVFRLGGVAVEIFMFVSGFLMLWHYLARETKEPWESPRTWLRFWCRRFFRMAPLYWLALTLVFLFHAPLHDWMDEVHRIFPLPWAGREIDPGRIDHEPGWGNIITHYTFVFGLFPQWASNNILPDWSITLEMQFYLCFPLIALLMRKAGWVITLALVIVSWQLFAHKLGVGLINAGGPWGWYPMPTVLPLRLGVFFAGMLAALGLHRWFSTGSGIAELLVSLGLSWWADPLLAAFVLVLIVWETTGEWMNSRLPALRRSIEAILSSRAIGRFADASYGIYLCHSLILLGVLWLLLQWPQYESLPAVQRFALLVAAATLPIFFISLALHRWVEKPGIAIGRKLIASKQARIP